MDASIFGETTFADGETRRRNISRLRRAPDGFGSENLGLLLDDASQGGAGTDAPPSPLTVFLDGAHIRCRPEYQKRHLDVVVGKVESPNVSRRFGLVQQAVSSPAKQLRQELIAQGWDSQNKVTVISDGDPAESD